MSQLASVDEPYGSLFVYFRIFTPLADNHVITSHVTLCKSGKSGFGLVSVELSHVKSGECSQNGI
jgi:hypothetical protein